MPSVTVVENDVRSEVARQPAVALCTICPGSLDLVYVQSVLRLQRVYHGPLEVYVSHAGPALGPARSGVVQFFLRDLSPDWLLCIDADVGFPGDTLDLMLAAAADASAQVIGVVVPVDAAWRQDSTGLPNCYRLDPDRKEYVRCDVAPPVDSWREVDAIGAAILLVHREVLQDMLMAPGLGPRWFSEVECNGYVMGEDVGFCHRARERGHRIVAVTVPNVVHVKRKLLRLP